MHLFKDEKFLASLLPSLGLLFGHIFMWSNNVHMFEPSALFVSLAVVFIASIILSLLNYKILLPSSRIFRSKCISDIFFYTVIASLFIFFTWSMIDYRHIVYKNKVYAPILTFLTFILLYKNKANYLSFFFVIMIFFSSLNLIKNTFFSHENNIEVYNIPNISLKNKPNIYLFWQESYQSYDILQSTFTFDNSKFLNFLDKNKFYIDNNNQSSGSHTLMAMSQTYSCGMTPIKVIGNNDVAVNIRNMIGGSDENFVYKTLKDNNYKTVLIVNDSTYYFYNRLKNLDETDTEVDITYSKIIPIFTINYFLDVKSIYKSIKAKKGIDAYQGNLFERVKHAIHRNKNNGRPLLLIFKGGVQHTPSDGSYTWEDRDQWIKRGYYRNLLVEANKENEKILSYILQEDPSGLIIVLGDHGAWTYRSFPEHGEGEPYVSGKKFGITPQQLLDDRYKVLFAYRLPNGDTFDLSQGMYMNNINVFMHVFAYLAQDPSILKYRVRSESSYGNAKMVEGVLQP